MSGLSLPSVSFHDDAIPWNGVAADCKGWTRTFECTGHIIESCDGLEFIRPDQDDDAEGKWFLRQADLFPAEATLSVTKWCAKGPDPSSTKPIRVRIQSVVTITPLEDGPVPPEHREWESVLSCPRSCHVFRGGVYVGYGPVTRDAEKGS